MKKKLRVGIVGCGMVARNHARGYLESKRGEVTVVYDRHTPAARDFAAKIGATAAPDLESMIKEVDAVSICTPPGAHWDSSLPFLRAGVPVLCEKPLEANDRNAAHLAAEVRKSGTLFMTAYTHRFHPPILEALKVLRRGVLGAPLFFRNSFGGKLDFGDNFRTDPKLSGGGCLSDTATHSADLYRLFMGEVTAVSAFTAKTVPGLRVEDFGIVLLRGKGTRIGEIMATSALPVIANKLEIACEEGLLTVAYYVHGLPDLSVQRDATKPPKAIRVAERPAKFTGQAIHFLDCVRKGTLPESTVEDGVEGCRIINAAYRSAATGRTVELPFGNRKP